jgi:hypothetical protein
MRHMQIKQAVLFVRRYGGRLLSISLLLLVPCFWHKRIEAGDVASHTYNAWLAHLVNQGQAPGLYIESRWNNVLVDLTLQKLGEVFGLIAAERILVVVTVLIFFWGAFALISAANRRPPWFLIPAIAMITYGWTFYSGFLNFYLAIGLAFFAAALFWRGSGRDLVVAGGLAVIALLAHPFGFLCLMGMAAYLRLADMLRGWRRWALLASAFVVVLAFHFYLLRFRTAYWHTKDFYFMNGMDQLFLFRTRYALVALGVLVFSLVCFFYGTAREWKTNTERWSFRAPFELWVVLLFAAMMIPEVVWLPQYSNPFALIISRLTAVTGVLGLCVLGSVRPRNWHLAGLAAGAALFFLWSYQDTGMLNRMEQQVESMVNTLPYGRRVIETINLPDESRLWFVNHIVDRACIGKCFAYADYEPPSKQFRLRVTHGSPIVTDSADDGFHMETGFYVVRQEDLPMNEIYQCDDKDLSRLCMRELSAGEENGRTGYRPTRFQ